MNKAARYPRNRAATRKNEARRPNRCERNKFALTVTRRFDLDQFGYGPDAILLLTITRA